VALHQAVNHDHPYPRQIAQLNAIQKDFADMAAAGVRLLGEVGLGSVKAGDEAKLMVSWARKHGIQSTIHTGGPSIPGSGLIDADVVLEADTLDKDGLNGCFRSVFRI
jgi:enamidase